MSTSFPPDLPPRPNRPEPIRTLYFAFGSNLHLQQMATRCPNSKYIGRATLKHFRWQINQRGYANVVPEHGYWVEGLVFEIDSDDERRLDKSEGVAKKCIMDDSSGKQIVAPCYRKEYRRVWLHPAAKALYRRSVPWIVEKGGPARLLTDDLKEGGTTREFRGRWKDNVLVYASPDFVRNGRPKEEYIKRINNGIRDARILDMSAKYIEHFVRTYVPPDGQATTGTHVYPLKQPPQSKTQMQAQDRRMSVIEPRPAREGLGRRESTSYEEIIVQQRPSGRQQEENDRQGRMLARARNGRPAQPRAQSVEGWVRRKPATFVGLRLW